MEKIQTGLTANYVSDWTVIQGLKEAMQNIAYGSVKGGKIAKLYFDSKTGLWSIRDRYTGFEKRHLYIGESGQRDDEDGLGTFGEGWKLFLLVMARNNIQHLVETVGFTFWGVMSPTQHGVDTLVINVLENETKIGTKVSADVSEAQWRTAAESFGILRGIDPELLKRNTIIPETNGELFVQGVRIENEDTTNPLKLHFSYNLAQRDLMNRDRSHVNVEDAYAAIKMLIFRMARTDVEDYIGMALRGSDAEDILRGPWIPVHSEGDQRLMWLDILAELHACTTDDLVIPSYNVAVNDEAKKRGMTLLDTPRKWDWELSYLGIRKADDVIEDQYDIVEQGAYSVSDVEKTAFSKAKAKIKKAMGLTSVNELPTFQYVEEIKSFAGDDKVVHYDRELDMIYIATSIMHDESTIVKHLLPEVANWRYRAVTAEGLEIAYKRMVMRLLGL